MLDSRRQTADGRQQTARGMKIQFDKVQLRIAVLVFFIALIVSGCASTKAPRGWLESPSNVNFNAWGGWIQLKVLPDKAKSIEDFDDNFLRYDLNIGGGEFICF